MLRKQVKYLATNCKEMFVIVEKEKEETDRVFGTDSVILTKGIDFSKKEYQSHTVNTPLKFVYTGRLIIGRDKTLALLADLLNKINGDEQKATLEIYSPDTVGDGVMARLNSGCSKHCGCVSRDEVQEIQKSADVVVFAEALEGKESKAARLSFSTKITDYLSNGKCVLAIGKEDIAPIDYFVRNQSAIVATSATELEEKLRFLIGNPEQIEAYSQKAFACAKRNHDKEIIDERFMQTIRRAVNKE
jgi:glycosyltransferase involved in cell wall biosynthesis